VPFGFPFLANNDHDCEPANAKGSASDRFRPAAVRQIALRTFIVATTALTLIRTLSIG
jgi:hypothetical protein